MSTIRSSPPPVPATAARPLGRFAGRLGSMRGAVPWPAVVALAAAMAFADGFWAVTTLGAVGAIERQQHPFLTFLVGSTALVPVCVLAVLAALGFARRHLGPALTSVRQVAGATVLVALAGSIVGSAVVVGSALYDYELQRTLLQDLAQNHHQSPTALQDTWALNVRAARITSLLMVGTNVVLAAWVLALFGGRLDAVRGRLGRRRRA